MRLEQKERVVERLTARMREAPAMIVTDYRGLTVTSVDEEHRLNPRVADTVGEDDFVGYMQNLSLPHPKLLDIAIPANLRLGASPVHRPSPQRR